MGRSISRFLLSHLEERLSCGKLYTGEISSSVQLMGFLDVLPRGTSTMITLACRTERAMAIHWEPFKSIAQSLVDIAIVVSCTESQHARTIGSFPPESACMGSCSHQSKIVHATLTQHLWQLGLMAEIVWQPTHSSHTAKA